MASNTGWKNRDIAQGLWARRHDSDGNGVKLRDDNKLYFGECRDEAKIEEFDEHLNRAITEVTEFVKKADGLEQYFPPVTVRNPGQGTAGTRARRGRRSRPIRAEGGAADG